MSPLPAPVPTCPQPLRPPPRRSAVAGPCRPARPAGPALPVLGPRVSAPRLCRAPAGSGPATGAASRQDRGVPAPLVIRVAVFVRHGATRVQAGPEHSAPGQATAISGHSAGCHTDNAMTERIRSIGQHRPGGFRGRIAGGHGNAGWIGALLLSPTEAAWPKLCGFHHCLPREDQRRLLSPQLQTSSTTSSYAGMRGTHEAR